MADQADKLREMIDSAPVTALRAPEGPPLVVVTGGRAGVGATTVAVNLAAVLADRGMRTLVVDAAPQANLMQAAGVAASARTNLLSDVLAGPGALAEAIVAGPAGVMLLDAGCGVSRKRGCESRRDSPTWARGDSSRHGQQRLLAELASAGNAVDVIVADIGSGPTSMTRRFWLRAQLVLMVTTTDGAALVDSYAAIKTSVTDALGPDVRLVVNQCEDDRLAAEAHDRFADACRRFLGRSVPALPSLPRSHRHEDGGERFFPRVWEIADTPFGHAALWLGRAVSDVLEGKIEKVVPLVAA